MNNYQKVLIVFILGLFIYINLYQTKSKSILTASCNEIDDNSCTLYNHIDIKSKCDSLCNAKNGTFNEHHTFKEHTHTCECTPKTEKFENILPKTIPIDDSNRNITDQLYQNRLKSLIFG